MIKRALCVALALIIGVSCVLCMTSCSSLPEIDSVRERFIYLIEQSKQLNVIFFGVGLPVYDRDDELTELRGIYYDDKLPSYNTVTYNSPYFTKESIKKKAETIFSEKYLSLLYESAFEGLINSGSTYLRFYEYEGKIYQDVNAKNFGLSERIYDYSTMKIVTPSNNEYINVTVQTYTLEDRKMKEVSLSFSFERGNWYLDCPTY